MNDSIVFCVWLIVSTSAVDVVLEVNGIVFLVNDTIIVQAHDCLCKVENIGCTIYHKNNVEAEPVRDKATLYKYSNDYFCEFDNQKVYCNRLEDSHQKKFCSTSSEKSCLLTELVSYGYTCPLGHVRLLILRPETFMFHIWKKELLNLFVCTICTSPEQEDKTTNDIPEPGERSSNSTNHQDNQRIIIIILSSVLGAVVLLIVVVLIICLRRQRQRQRSVVMNREMPEAVQHSLPQINHEEIEMDSIHDYASLNFSIHDYLDPRAITEEQALSNDHHMTESRIEYGR
nr:hypothetical protein BgiMline_013924 [Biomphalaria glabrata]